MKLLLSVLVAIIFSSSINAQLKIDSNYAIVINNIEYRNGSSLPFYPAVADLFRIKELSSGNSCAMVSADWTLKIGSEVFPGKTLSERKILLDKMRPQDQIFIDKIKLESGCFTPPKQIVLGIM